MKVNYLDKDLQKYCISFEEHGEFFYFYNQREIISEFLIVFEQNVVSSANLKRVRFNCSFTIINRLPPSAAGFVELTNFRVWVTNVYEGVYFNEFIKSGIANDAKKIIIFNGLTGSSLRFKIFYRLCISVKSDEVRN